MNTNACPSKQLTQASPNLNNILDSCSKKLIYYNDIIVSVQSSLADKYNNTLIT